MCPGENFFPEFNSRGSIEMWLPAQEAGVPTEGNPIRIKIQLKIGRLFGPAVAGSGEKKMADGIIIISQWISSHMIKSCWKRQNPKFMIIY